MMKLLARIARGLGFERRSKTNAPTLENPTGYFQYQESSSWTLASVATEDLTPHFYFVLNDSVFVGDRNNHDQLVSGDYHKPIKLPDIPTKNEKWPTAREVLGYEDILSDYYFQIRDITGRHPVRGDTEYWLRLYLTSETTGEDIGFPWWDRVSESRELSAWLKGENDFPFCDRDQGWGFDAVSLEGRFHFRQSDPETGEEYTNISVRSELFLQRWLQAESDIRLVIERLKSKLGVDPWS